VRDVEALDALRHAREREAFLYLLEGALAPDRLVGALAQPVRGVLDRHFDEAPLLAPLRHDDRHPRAPQLAEVFRDRFHALEGERQEDFVGHEPVAFVESRHERGEHLLVGQIVVVELIGMMAHELAGAHEQDLRLDAARFSPVAEDVAVAAPVGHDFLLLCYAFDRGDAVAKMRGVFETFAIRRLAHAGAEVVDQLFRLAFEKPDRSL
jgi:hypothetical protein